MTWKAAGDRVLVTAPEKTGERTTDAGIVLPENAKKTLYEGTVLAAGPDAGGVLPGDLVSYMPSKYLVNVEDGIVSITADIIVAIKREEA